MSYDDYDDDTERERLFRVGRIDIQNNRIQFVVRDGGVELDMTRDGKEFGARLEPEVSIALGEMVNDDENDGQRLDLSLLLDDYGKVAREQRDHGRDPGDYGRVLEPEIGRDPRRDPRRVVSGRTIKSRDLGRDSR